MKYQFLVAAFLLLVISDAFSVVSPPDPLDARAIPSTPGLLTGSRRIVVDRQAVIQLGKSLFWDSNVGSDGMACGSCHFHAGADRRTRNQLNPGLRNTSSGTSDTFEDTASGAAGGPDYQLKSDDFPLHQFSDPAHRETNVVFTTDDVVGSAGTFLRIFQDVDATGVDQCQSANDAVFHLGTKNARRVTDRNAPSVINAAFNFRNFWDGRANNLFNGESAFGPRDPLAGVWVVVKGKPLKKRLLLANASLASLALAPPLNDVEMSCVSRTFHELGRKLISRRPLEGQEVHPEDSVLSNLRHATGKGLDTTYDAMIRKAFAKRYWAGTGQFGVSTGGIAYTQMEANFAFFFGLAIQIYEQTLVSDQSPFDSQRDVANIPIAFNDQQKRGLKLFMNSQCFICHQGPTFSAAAHPQVYTPKWRGSLKLVDRGGMFEDLSGVGVAKTLSDKGFIPTSVAPPEHDIGLGGRDPWGNPLSFAEQYQTKLADPTNPMIDPIKVFACDLGIPFAYDFGSSQLLRDANAAGHCRGNRAASKVPTPAAVDAELAKPLQGRLMVTVRGAFKIPSLRNVELTGPYMHNGSMKSLEEVVQFYDRGGNGFGNPQHPETLVFRRELPEQDKADLVAFLKTLTDERVRWERAPFDHPELLVPEGHDEQGTSPLGLGYAADRYLHVPAVGRNGRTTEQGPLRSFESYLAP
jgi:cytochrome c peroxidase